MLLIDGDIIKYAAAAQCEKPVYIAGGKEFDLKSQAKEYSKLKGGLPIERQVNYAPEWHVKLYADKMVEAIMERMGRTEHKIFLSGDSNFRDSIATIRSYKGNRDKRTRPRLLPQARDHLLSKYVCVVCDGEEADDGMGYTQTDSTVICSPDKDLDLVPGWHYNWREDSLYKVEQEESDYKFAIQLLMGDATDNVVGIPNVGPARARDMLRGRSGGSIHIIYDVASVRRSLADCIRTAYWKEYGRLEGTCDSVGALTENGRLLWIRRKPMQMWTMEDWEDERI